MNVYKIAWTTKVSITNNIVLPTVCILKEDPYITCMRLNSTHVEGHNCAHNFVHKAL
jgi:hypothetical protein